MNIVEEIRKFVEEEFNKPTAKYGPEPYEYHLVPMTSRAGKLGADKEVVLLAAWMHDIGSSVYGREDHHATGAEIAGNKLKEFDYPEDKIELIKKCIYNHRGSRCDSRETIEEIIIAEADAISNFDNIAGVFKAAFVFEGHTQGSAKESTRKKLENKWKQLTLDESKEMVRSKYEAAMILLG